MDPLANNLGTTRESRAVNTLIDKTNDWPCTEIEGSWHHDNPLMSESSRSSNFSTVRQDGVELVEKKNIDNAPNVEPMVNNPEEHNVFTTTLNSTIEITRVKLYGVMLLISASFLIIGIGLGVLIGLDRCPATILSELDNQVPSPQPTLHTAKMPSSLPPATDLCRSTFEFSMLSNAFFANTTRMQADCSITDAAPFMDFLLAGLRLETITGNLLALFGLCVIVQLGGIPSVLNSGKLSLPGLAFWLIWMAISVLQFITTFIAQLMGVLAAFSFVEQYQDNLETFQGGLGAGLGAGIGAGVGATIGCVIACQLNVDEYESYAYKISHGFGFVLSFSAIGSIMGALYGSFTGATFFAAIIPSLLFHPTFVAKNAALGVHAFTILQGMTASKLVAFDIDKAMTLYALVMVVPLLAIGTLYLILTASFIFSLFFFLPMWLCLTFINSALFLVLIEAKKGNQKYRKIASQFLECDSAECDLGPLNPLQPLHGALWWLPESFEEWSGAGFNVMLGIVLLSSLLIVLSPLLVFGHWAAFYSYLGRSSSDSMAYVALFYEHFFGVFVDADFNVPDFLNFNLKDVSDLGFALKDVPNFDVLPPAAMLEGSAIFLASSLLLSLIKPLVCLLSDLFSIAGIVGKNTKVGNVAVLGTYEGILKGLTGNECITALQCKNADWDCEVDEKGNIIVMRVPKIEFQVDFVANCESLSVFSALGNAIVGKKIPHSCLISRTSPLLTIPFLFRR